MHDSLIKEDFFNYVAFTQRQMRYKNRRGLDPQVKIFMDQEKLKISPAWNLPIPNEAAAYKSLAKYGKSEVLMTEELIKRMNKAWTFTERHFYPYMGNSRILTTREAVDRLDMSSSSGFPFNKLYPTKKELFEKDLEIIDWLENDWERLGQDPLWTTIASSSLKEELRPQEKIDENSLRTFTALAADATVQGNRLFVDQNEKMYAAHTISSSSIGMSPLKGNWDKLFRKLNVFKNGYALDESQYDSSLRQFLVWGCAQFRWKCYAPEFKTPENLQRVKTYYRNLVHTLILTPEGILVMKKLGMPSGCVNTVTDNTLILYTLLAFAWISLSPEEMNDYKSFEDNTAKALVGDDNTWTVSDEAHTFFNAVSVIETWKLVGITTTTDSLLPRPADELDFLSAHTVFIKGIAVPLYSRDKLMTSLLYAPQSHITPATTLQRCTNLLQIGWTDLVYRRFCRALIDWLLSEYDDVMRDDPRWISAKAGIFTDEAFFSLFTNRRSYFIPTQGLYQEHEERLIKPDKELQYLFIMSTPQKKQQQKSKSARKPRARGPKKGTKTAQPKKAPRQRRRRGGGGMRGNMTARTASGIGATSFGSSKARSITVSNDEFIGAVTVANEPNFNVTSYPINPGQSTTFPWLSRQAEQWERYRFSRLEFYYKREVSEFAAAGSAGKVIMNVDFDAADGPPITKQQMEDSVPHRDGMPCENITLVLPSAQMNPQATLARFVRTGGLPGSADIKTYDVGNLNVATQGIPSNTEVGELRVRYTCVFTVPVLESTISAPANNQVSQLISSANLVPVTETETDLLFANEDTADGYTNGLKVVNNGTGHITLPVGNYVVSAQSITVFTGSATKASLTLKKNNVPITPLVANEVFTAGTRTIIASSDEAYVSSNGTDYINVTSYVAYTTGSVAVTGQLIIRAV